MFKFQIEKVKRSAAAAAEIVSFLSFFEKVKNLNADLIVSHFKLQSYIDFSSPYSIQTELYTLFDSFSFNVKL